MPLHPHHKRVHKWLKVTALIPALALSFLDQTAIPAALPTIERELGANHTLSQWSVNSYLLAMAVAILMCGNLSKRVGHRLTFLLGILIFAIFSAFCGISPSVGFLICARTFQGIGAALMIYSQTALLASVLPPENQGRSTAFVVTISSIFMILGPLIGSYVAETVSWRWIFWMNLPIAIAGFWLARKFLPIILPQKKKISLEKLIEARAHKTHIDRPQKDPTLRAGQALAESTKTKS